MKRQLFVVLLLLHTCWAYCQAKSAAFRNKNLHNTALTDTEFKDLVGQNRFGKLFTYTNNSMVYGFIGDNYQRLRIKIISVKQSKIANSYMVYGKSMVKGNICEFHGVINITNIRKYKTPSNGVHEMYKNTGIKGQFIIIGDYIFDENQNQKHSGAFKGVFATEFYVGKDGKIKYDDIELNADGFNNNQFVGTWTEYAGKTSKRANWGDFRIPDSGDLDIGAGEFSPADKYLEYGWQSLRNRVKQESPGYKKAVAIEEAKWWL